MAEPTQEGAVCPVPQKEGWSALWKNEDWLAVWIGFFIIALVLFLNGSKLLDPSKVVPSYKWATDGQIASRVPSWNASIDELTKSAEKAGEQGTVNRLTSLKEALAKGDRKEIGVAAERVDRIGGIPGAVGKEIAGHAKALPDKVFTGENMMRVLKIFILFGIVATIGLKFFGANLGRFIAGFPIVFLLAWLSRFIAGNAGPVDWGIEYVVFALAIGLSISNFFTLPEWLMEAVRTEYYIKSGLVVLGAGLLFFEIVQAGFLGIIQAVLVIFVVWYFCFWLCRKLKVDDDFGAMLSSAVSICGVSAAIASCGAIQGDKKKLSYVTSLVLIVAVPMMILMPWSVKAFNIPDIVGGAWLGGTLDTSGSVVAAGALISEAAMKTGVIVKFDTFGLADLHQLRGRVGRYKHRAYAYIILPVDRPITPEAEKRVKAIEEFAELGAGFRIAMRDLEIRGAGNSLGTEQHGHIAAVGYEMYCRLLELAVRKSRHGPIPEPIDVSLDLHLESFIPHTYIREDALKMDIYRRLNRSATFKEVKSIAEEMADRFGDIPHPVRNLLSESELSILAQQSKIRSMVKVDGVSVVRAWVRATRASVTSRNIPTPAS